MRGVMVRSVLGVADTTKGAGLAAALLTGGLVLSKQLIGDFLRGHRYFVL